MPSIPETKKDIKTTGPRHTRTATDELAVTQANGNAIRGKPIGKDHLKSGRFQTLENFASLFEKYLGFNVAGAGSTPLHYAACGGNAVCCQVCAAISARGERPEDWVPPEDVSAVHYAKCDGIDETLPMGADGNDGIVDIFSAHSYYDAAEYSQLAEEDMEGSSTMDQVVKNTQENMSWLSIWWQQFVDASMMPLMASFSNRQVQRHPPLYL
eukprot:XP_020407728.1 uncharacterized protein LOC109945783 [Zea mays]